MARICFDIVDRKWRIKGYEEFAFSTENDAHTAHDFAVAYAPDMVAAFTGGAVSRTEIFPTPPAAAE